MVQTTCRVVGRAPSWFRTLQGEMLPVLRLSLGNVFACASGVLRQLRAGFVYAIFEL